MWAKCRLTEPWCPELVAAFQHQDYYNLISLLWILQVTDTASLHHTFPNWKIYIQTMLCLAWQWLWRMDWHGFPFFFVLSTTHINWCSAWFFPIITLIMFIFMIVYPINNVCNFFSSSGISFLDFLIWHPQYSHQVKIYLSTLPCTCSFLLCLWHRHKLAILVLAASSSLFILLLHNFLSLVLFLF